LGTGAGCDVCFVGQALPAIRPSAPRCTFC
jgi:hypothetical protein